MRSSVRPPGRCASSEGVSFAMSFICGLSTIATLIDPPFDAGDPPLDDELLEPPPQPTPTAVTAAKVAATDPRRTMPLMDLSSCFDAEAKYFRTPLTYNVGLCWLSRPFGQ